MFQSAVGKNINVSVDHDNAGAAVVSLTTCSPTKAVSSAPSRLPAAFICTRKEKLEALPVKYQMMIIARSAGPLRSKK